MFFEQHAIELFKSTLAGIEYGTLMGKALLYNTYFIKAFSFS